MKAIRLRCEQMENPLGIDVQKPCLSWICQDGIHQTAYEIEAKTGEDVIYNSGKVASDSMNVMLDADLASKQQVVWHVRLWDEKDVCDEFLFGNTVQFTDTRHLFRHIPMYKNVQHIIFVF